MRFLRRHVATMVVAMVTAAVTAGGPAVARIIADYAKNADKVDGKHAVGYRATVARRKGKLVAVSRISGRLPNNIIKRAPDANRLDGIDSSGFVRNRGLIIDNVGSGNYQPLNPAPMFTMTRYSNETVLTATSGGSGYVLVQPNTPSVLYGRRVKLAGVSFLVLPAFAAANDVVGLGRVTFLFRATARKAAGPAGIVTRG